jgi:cytochrome c oxidase subunit 1
MTTAEHAERIGLWQGFYYVRRGVLWGLIGFGLGVGLAALFRTAAGSSPWWLEHNFAVGYVLGLLGWLLGVGMWERWVKEWLGLPTQPNPHGWMRYFAFTTDHKVIGVQYLVTFVAVFLIAGLLAMLMRYHLMDSQGALFNGGVYNQVMSLHGILMIAVAVAVIIGGFGNFLVPLMIGARDMAFPRLNALTYWLIPPVAVLLLTAQAVGGWDTGWTAYPPLAVRNAAGQLFFNLAIITFGLSSILGGLNFLVTISFLRAPGMTWGRLPIFVWSIFSASIIALIFTQAFAAAMLMEAVDRLAGTNFFNPGDPLLYQHVFWFYSHPAVYIFILPGFGILLEVLTHFSRKPLFAYRWAVAGFLTIVAISGIVWAHHMFVTTSEVAFLGAFLVTTEAISIPTGLVFLSALGTIWMGKLWLTPPMLFALGALFNFLIGGITGIYLADVPSDIQLSDTYFVVAHFHYTIIGGEIFALLAAIYYWFPKITGRMYHQGLGKLHFWLTFLGFNLTFLPMFWAGLHGMNRRIAIYDPALEGVNVFASIAAFVMGAGFLVFVGNMVWSWVRGKVAEANPWRARTLEWQVPSPPPEENFPAPPVVVGEPYEYGVPGAGPHVVLAPAGGDCGKEV